MDPLSATLAAVSLATAVKDIVGLGQKVHKSFAKNTYNGAQVSSNLRNAQCVANDIKEMVEEIKFFCEEHEGVLDDMHDFCLALHGLLGKLRSFETSILPLLPQTGGKTLDRLIRGWDMWRNNSKIEGSILDLQNDIMKVIRRFMVKSAMRTEVRHQETNRALTVVHKDITQGLQILRGVQKDVSTIRITADAIMTHSLYEAPATATNDFTRNIIIFAQSTPSASTPMLRTPDVMISEELITTAYIRLQLNTIAITLEKMSQVPTYGSLDDIAKFRLCLMTELASMSTTSLRHHVIRQITSIRDLLDNKPTQTVSILDGADALSRLSSGLELLGMGHESTFVGEWAIVLARTLVNVSGSGQPDLCASLAQYLLYQSARYAASGKSIPAHQAIEEAHAITRNLREQYGGELHFQMLYSNILSQYALLENSIKMSIDAVQLLEGVLNVHSFTLSEGRKKLTIDSVVQPSSAFLDHLFYSAPLRSAITYYACALQQMGQLLFLDGQFNSALHLELLAIAVHRMMVSIHGPGYKVYLAKSLLSPVRRRLASSFCAEDLAHMADECIVLLRELAERNPLTYSRDLVSVLCDKASVLGILNREVEAIAIWEEAASLAGKIVQDAKLRANALDNLSHLFRRLKRHDDAVQTRTLAITTHQDEDQALRHLYLSEDLRKLQRYKESAEAARTSLAMYRRVAMSQPGTWTNDLTHSLSNLVVCLATSGDCAEALITWREFMNILDSHLTVNPDSHPNQTILDEDLSALDRCVIISQILNDEEQCLEICSTAIRYLRRGSTIYQENAYMTQSLLSVEFRYAHNMARFSRLRDAHQYIDHWIDAWSCPPEAISEFEIAIWHTKMVTLKADVLNAQGYTQEALLVIQKVHDILKLSLSTYQRSIEEMVYAMILEAQLQAYVGNSEKALQIAEGALQFIQNSTLGPTLDGLVRSMHAVGFTALLCCNYERASEAAREAYNISTGSEWQREYNVYILPSLFATLSSAEANLGRSSTGVDYARRAIEASLEIKGMRHQIPVSFSELSYMETRGNLANILLATGDLVQARQICEERSAYFTKRVEKRMGDFRELVPTLRMLGILCCSEGLHEKGDAAAQELSRNMKLLGDIFPSLHEQVKIRLRHQVKAPILRVLEEMSEKLDCDHQKKVMSFFIV